MRIPLLIFLLIITANFPIDIHVPAMPEISQAFAVTVSQTQWTISIFLLGFGASPILFGILSDKFGRRNVMLYGLFILLIGSFACSFTNSFSILLLGRLLQGIGAAACSVTSRTVMRDCFEGKEMARVFSLIGAGVELSLALSPVIGGYLVSLLGWRSNFQFIAILVMSTMALCYFLLKETNQHIDRSPIKFKSTLSSITATVSNPGFLRYAPCSAAALSAGMSYFTLSPFIIQNTLHYSAKAYGWLTLLVTGSIVLGSFINALLVSRLGIERLAKLALLILLVAGLILFLDSLLFTINIYTLIITSALAFFALAFLFGNCMSGALQAFSKKAGIASSLYSTLQIFTSFIVTGLLSLLSYDNSLVLSLVYIACASLPLLNFNSKFSQKAPLPLEIRD